MNLAFVAGVLAGTQSRSRHAVLSPSTGAVLRRRHFIASRADTATAHVDFCAFRRSLPEHRPTESCLEITPTSTVVTRRSGSRGARIDTCDQTTPTGGSNGATDAVVVPGTHTQHRRTRWTDEWIDGHWPRARAPVASVAALGLFQSSAEASGAPRTTPAGPSLYDRLGGYFGIALVVNRFSDQIIKNPVLKKNPGVEGVEQDAEGSAAAWPQVWSHAVDRGAAGGTFVYTGLPLERSSRGVQSHRRTVRRSWRRDRPVSTTTGCRNESNRNWWPPTEPACPTS